MNFAQRCRETELVRLQIRIYLNLYESFSETSRSPTRNSGYMDRDGMNLGSAMNLQFSTEAQTKRWQNRSSMKLLKRAG